MGIANTRARRSVDTCIQQSAKSCLGSAALFPGGPRLNLPLTTRNLEVEVARDLYLRHPVASRIIASSRKTLNHPLDQSKSYLFHEHRRIQVVVHWCDGLDSCNPRSPSNLELYYTDCVPAPHNVQKTQLINIGRGQTEGEAASIRPQAERKVPYQLTFIACYFLPILRLTRCTAFSSSRRQTRSCSYTGSERLLRFPQLTYSPAEISHRSTRGLSPTWIRQFVISMARHIAWPPSGKRSRKVGSCLLGGETTVGCWMCPWTYARMAGKRCTLDKRDLPNGLPAWVACLISVSLAVSVTPVSYIIMKCEGRKACSII